MTSVTAKTLLVVFSLAVLTACRGVSAPEPTPTSTPIPTPTPTVPPVDTWMEWACYPFTCRMLIPAGVKVERGILAWSATGDPPREGISDQWTVWTDQGQGARRVAGATGRSRPVFADPFSIGPQARRHPPRPPGLRQGVGRELSESCGYVCGPWWLFARVMRATGKLPIVRIAERSGRRVSSRGPARVIPCKGLHS